MTHDSPPGFNLIDYMPIRIRTKYKGKIRLVKQIAFAIYLTKAILMGISLPIPSKSIRKRMLHWFATLTAWPLPAMIKTTVVTYRSIV